MNHRHIAGLLPQESFLPQKRTLIGDRFSHRHAQFHAIACSHPEIPAEYAPSTLSTLGLDALVTQAVPPQ